MLIKQNPSSLVSDSSQCKMKLIMAVATQRVEDVACCALRMDPNNRRSPQEVAKNQRKRRLRVHMPSIRLSAESFKSKHAKISPLGRQVHLREHLQIKHRCLHLNFLRRWHRLIPKLVASSANRSGLRLSLGSSP